MKLKLIVTWILAFSASIAFAGAVVQAAGVEVDLDNRVAVGNMMFARIAKNDEEFIGCGIRVFDDGVTPFSFGFCQAGDSEENRITCFTMNPNLLDVMKATSAFSFITFSWQDGGFGGTECIRVGFSTQSFYLPNFTTKGKK